MTIFCYKVNEISSFFFSELQSIGVKCLAPTSGYYIFPDFEVMRPKLNERGIKTCEEMCQAMTKECSVVVGLYECLDSLQFTKHR